MPVAKHWTVVGWSWEQTGQEGEGCNRLGCESYQLQPQRWPCSSCWLPVGSPVTERHSKAERPKCTGRSARWLTLSNLVAARHTLQRWSSQHKVLGSRRRSLKDPRPLFVTNSCKCIIAAITNPDLCLPGPWLETHCFLRITRQADAHALTN